MILYLDTSALLKLYLEEPGTETTRQAVRTATAACTHIITYAEICAALAQAVRMQRISAQQQANQKQRFEADWETLDILPADEPLARRAGQLAETFELRGFDSVHLAAAERIWRQVAGHFQIASSDRRLSQAALALGMSGITHYG